jgi:hypothetical protein
LTLWCNSLAFFSENLHLLTLSKAVLRRRAGMLGGVGGKVCIFEFLIYKKWFFSYGGGHGRGRLDKPCISPNLPR